MYVSKYIRIKFYIDKNALAYNTENALIPYSHFSLKNTSRNRKKNEFELFPL